MDPNAPADRPVAFLVTTTASARAAREHLGSPAYSYGFVLDALAPILERLGTWQHVDQPESRLAYAAARAVERGYRPVHLALVPLQDVYHTPAVPTILFPFWEFPRLPDRDFGYDTRQNWVRLCRPASLILTACHFTAEAFRRAGVDCPVAVVPVPIPESDLPTWRPTDSVTFTCRHIQLGGEFIGPLPEPRPELEPDVEPDWAAPLDRLLADEMEALAWPGRKGDPAPLPLLPEVPVQPAAAPRPRLSWKRRTWLLARRGYHRVYPWFDPATHERIARVKRTLMSMRGQSPPMLAYRGLRATYRWGVRPWLSDHAIARVTATRERLLRRAGQPPIIPMPPLLPSHPLTLRGLTFTTIFNLGDLRKNYMDLLSAFLVAFRDRPDVTLVIKLVTNPRCEMHEAQILGWRYGALGFRHRCRVVLVTEYLDDSQMRTLMRGTTVYVNASHAEGACLPLQEALAAGRPVIAPDHTAMADYIDDRVAFVVRSHPEPIHWPHDPEQRLETECYRPVWPDIRDAFLKAAAQAERRPDDYAAMSRAGRQRMIEVAHPDVVEAALRAALDRLPEDLPIGADSWTPRNLRAVRAAS